MIRMCEKEWQLFFLAAASVSIQTCRAEGEGGGGRRRRPIVRPLISNKTSNHKLQDPQS